MSICRHVAGRPGLLKSPDTTEATWMQKRASCHWHLDSLFGTKTVSAELL